MFDIGFWELVIIATIALLVVGPDNHVGGRALWCALQAVADDSVYDQVGLGSGV